MYEKKKTVSFHARSKKKNAIYQHVTFGLEKWEPLCQDEIMECVY